jgi:hypothetical protein
MKPSLSTKRLFPLGIVVAGLGIAVLGQSAASGDGKERSRNPIAQIIALLTEQSSDVSAIKSDIETIKKALTPSADLKLSSGSFGLPGNAASVDWEVLNNSTATQTVTVTVFRVPGVGPKTVAPPGPLTVSIDPGAALHNANSVGHGLPFEPGFDYEVVVNTTNLNVMPRVDIWSDFGNTVIPGTLIPAGAWVRLQ